MDIGSKIRKIRDLKGYSQENMANELNMSITGYGKIERNEVSVSTDKLKKISEILDVPISKIIDFNENSAFNNYSSKIEWQIGNYNLPIEIIKLYDDKIKLLEEKIKFLEKQNESK